MSWGAIDSLQDSLKHSRKGSSGSVRHVKEGAIGNAAASFDAMFFSQGFCLRKCVSSGLGPTPSASLLFGPVEKHKSVTAFTDETHTNCFLSGLQVEGLFRRSASIQTIKDVQKLYNQGKLLSVSIASNSVRALLILRLFVKQKCSLSYNYLIMKPFVT